MTPQESYDLMEDPRLAERVHFDERQLDDPRELEPELPYTEVTCDCCGVGVGIDDGVEVAACPDCGQAVERGDEYVPG